AASRGAGTAYRASSSAAPVRRRDVSARRRMRRGGSQRAGPGFEVGSVGVVRNLHIERSGLEIGVRAVKDGDAHRCLTLRQTLEVAVIPVRVVGRDLGILDQDAEGVLRARMWQLEAVAIVSDE